MKTFDGIVFRGTFRDYQQRVLDTVENHIQDGKINIVAAPGSGKTILGLELIRRQKSPCLIFSPTVTIRDQWGERFEGFFVPEGEKLEKYYSSNLNKLSLLNSITYQAMYSALKKIKVETEDETIDYSNIDLFKLVKEQGIKTICLDEAHHLQNEWQKSLEMFVKGLDKDVMIISLTATPPYDATAVEWERYQTICGQIDEEISVPELVKTNTLCPHQDFVYLNFPTEKEVKNFKDYKERANNGIKELINSGLLEPIYNSLINTHKDNFDFLYTNAKEIIALFILLNKAGYKIPQKLKKMLTTKGILPKFDLKYGERAVNFLLSSEITSEEAKEEISKIFKKYSLIEKRKVCLDLNDKLKKQVYSSMGKLKSIETITESEISALGKKLRMLILTDYIKKESIKDIGTNNEISNISIVSIFESLRRKFPKENIGVLSGSLVVLPNALKEHFIKIEKLTSKDFSLKPIENTNYSVFNFKGGNKQKVQIVSKIFKDGLINILVGTKSLLGEGWDSPCINSLILASFVGSFMLSNQMRGRAIRIDKNAPDKVSNIWHLATVEPEYILEENFIKRKSKKLSEQYYDTKSCDLEMLERRFECFVGPSFSGSGIESGIDRISHIKPPYNKENVDKINAKTLELSKQRDVTKASWTTDIKGSARTFLETDIPKEKKVRAFTFQNILLELLIFGLITYIVYFIYDVFIRTGSIIAVAGGVVAIGLLIAYSGKISDKIMSHLTPKQSIKTMAKAVLHTLKFMGEVQSNCYVKIKQNDKKDLTVVVCGASVREENIFNTAITELFSPIENPRYILARKHIFNEPDERVSLAVPSIIGQKKEYTEEFFKEIQKHTGKLLLIYTRNEEGRRFILSCRKKSYITLNYKQINKKHKVSNWE